MASKYSGLSVRRQGDRLVLSENSVCPAIDAQTILFTMWTDWSVRLV